MRGRLRRGEVEVQEGSAGVVRSVEADVGGSQLYRLILHFLIYNFVQGQECLYKLAIAELHAVVQTI